MLRRFVKQMGTSLSRQLTHIDQTGKVSRTDIQIGEASDSSCHQVITTVNSSGTTLTDVKKIGEEKWVGTISNQPYIFRLFGVNSQSVTYPTLQSQLPLLQNTTDLMNLLQ